MTNANFYTEEERRSHVEQWKESGLTQSEYARINSLNERTLNTWVRKSKDTEGGQLVLVSKRQASGSHNISIEYMGAMIKVDEDSLECVFRALRRANG